MLSVPKVGRPRNAWSPSRKRKLVRLYLFTRLTIDEIKDILAAIGFKPSRSDTQKKLHELLPHDYRADYRTFRPKDDSQMRNRFEILQFSMYKRSVSPREGEDQAQTKVVYEVEGANTAFPNFAKITGASLGGVQLSQLVKNPRIILDGSSAIESLNSEPRTKSRRFTTRHRSSWNPSPASSSRGSEYKESEALSIGSIERRLGTSYSPAYLDHIGSVLQYSSPSSSGSSLSSSSPGSSSLSRISIQHSGLALSPSHLADCSRDRSWLESSSRLFKRAQEAWDEYIDESTLSPMVEFTCPAIRCSELNRYSSDNQAERLCNDCGVTRAHLLFSRDAGTRGEVPPIHSQVEQYLSQRDYYGNTPLHYAAASGNLEYLLDAGPRAMTKRNTAGQGVLHFIRCSKAEHVQTTMRIMSLMNNRFAQSGNGSSIFQARDCRGRTILHNLFESTSSEMYTPSVVEFLLDLTGVDIHTADNRGKSLLQMLNAKAEVHTDTLLKEFIRSRASLSVYSCGIPVVTSSDCAHNVLFDRYSLLLTSSRTSSDIIFELEKLAMWRTTSLDIDWIDADGNTLLHALIRYWKDSNAESELTKIIKRLLTVRFYRRADFIEFRDRHGNTPLAAAAARGRRAVVKLLLNERANIHARNNGGDGIRKQVLKSKRSAKRGGQTELHARLESTLTLLGDSGAKDNPSRVDEWMTPQGKAELLKSLEGAATAPISI